MSYVVFGLGAHQLALPLSAVEAVERPGRFTAVPFAAPWLRGVTAIRGRVVPVVDLGSFAQVAPAGLDPSARLILTRGAGNIAALLVDRVMQIVQPESAPEPVTELGQPLATWCASAFERDGVLIPILDTDRLMASDAFCAMQLAPEERALFTHRHLDVAAHVPTIDR